MKSFLFSREPLEPRDYSANLADPAAGAYATFEGWVRDNNEGRAVIRLDYEAYEALGVKEGERIVAAALEKFDIARADDSGS